MSTTLIADTPASKPTGRFLFQPQLLWGNLESTVQGTGFLIEHEGKNYGVTSIHFLNFDVGGLITATWTDIASGEPVLTFRASVGYPDRTSIRFPSDIRHDYLLLVAPAMRENCTRLQLEFVERYIPGTRLWFPNKSQAAPEGYEWISATLTEDAGNYLKARLDQSITLQSQSGSPILSAETGKVIGLLNGGEELEGHTVLTFCPARSLVRTLRHPSGAVSLELSIRKPK